MVLTRLQRAIVFPGVRRIPPCRSGFGLEGLERFYREVDGERIEAWLLPALDALGPAPIAIYAHGNGELIDDWPELFEPLRRAGIHLLLPEYRGYGRSTGEPSEEAIVDDFVHFHDRLVARPDVDASRTIYIGRSLGGGVVTSLARRRPPAALVLMSTFTSLAEMVKAFGLPRRLASDPFESLSFVRGYEGPLFIIHGDRDDMIPCSHAHRLAEAAKDAQLRIYPADHADCPPDFPVFCEELLTFLEQKGILDPGAQTLPRVGSQ